MAEREIWWSNGIIYQIYPWSFASGNGDRMGDLPGITSKLDYLQDLGIRAIWLSPIYPSPDADFGYDVSDHTAVDPRMGTLHDFDHLVREAHQRGLKIILDLVLNHTSDQHPWFVESRSSRQNPFRDWYIWRDPKPFNRPPNNWQSVFGGKAWHLDETTGQAYYHMFLKEQPDLNWRNPAVRKAQLNVLKFWLDRGVDGFRLDAFNLYYKHMDLPDNPWKPGIRSYDRQRHIFDVDLPEMKSILREFRATLDGYSERYMVGETFGSTPALAASYCGNDMLNAAFNFEILHAPWKPARFLKAIRQWEEALSANQWPNYALGNHDTQRIATRYCGKTQSDDRAKIIAGLLLTLRGTPFIYYGDEIGMRDVSLRRHEIQDPPSRRYFPFYNREGARSPMQWNANPYAGFSTEKPWIRVNPNFQERNVTSQLDDPDSILNFYRRLIALRNCTPALQSGDFIPLQDNPVNGLAYYRSCGEEIVLVALNFQNQSEVIQLDSDITRFSWDVLFSDARSLPPDMGKNSIHLDPYEVCILRKTGIRERTTGIK